MCQPLQQGHDTVNQKKPFFFSKACELRRSHQVSKSCVQCQRLLGRFISKGCELRQSHQAGIIMLISGWPVLGLFRLAIIPNVCIIIPDQEPCPVSAPFRQVQLERTKGHATQAGTPSRNSVCIHMQPFTSVRPASGLESHQKVTQKHHKGTNP